MHSVFPDSPLKEEAFAIAREAVAASMPDEAVRRALAELAPAKGRTVAVAVGKAAWPMAQAAAQALAGRLDAGYVITKYGHAQGELPGFQVFEAGHPQMDETACAPRGPCWRRCPPSRRRTAYSSCSPAAARR